MSKGQLVFYTAVILTMCFQSNATEARDNNLTQKVITLKSLEISHQVDLSRIFKPTEKQIGIKPKVGIVSSPEESVTIQLVGTMILGEKKVAWLKVENQVYQLESGQSIPGLKRQIVEINPESVVLIYEQPCEIVDSCDSPLTLTIRDALF